MKEHLVLELLHERPKEIWSVIDIILHKFSKIFDFLTRLETFKL